MSVFTSKQKEIIIKDYNGGATLTQIASKIESYPEKVSLFLKQNGVKFRKSRNIFNRPYVLDDGYFTEINSSEKAYFLGLLFADGFVSPKTNLVSLVSIDADILEKFRKGLACNKNFYKNPNHEKAWTFSFSSEKIKKDLISLGCVPTKSLILEFPKSINKMYLWDFIRGYFDGDGSIYISQKLHQMKIIGSTKFCQGLVEFFNSNEISCNIESEKRFKPQTSYVRICKKKDLLKIAENFYLKDGPCLERKKNKFLTIQ